ncbi:FtsX-like permease family protein [Kitasatospora sp. NPDC059648]|uniref:FtsX-like permease family protein n=1 Tax=Kitasatospora sp. NPDC059648 TaxID=3346894 RepID=UPI00368966AB
MAGTTTAIAASVALFIVLATFAFVTDQRRRELALLRLVGATPRQVRALGGSEAVPVGLGASVVGCVLGALGSGRLCDWMTGHGVAPRWFEIGADPLALLIAFLLGTTAAAAGAGTVALRAASVRPVEALREARTSRRPMTPLRRVLGLAMLAGAVVTGQVIAADSPVDAVNPREYGMVPLLFTGAFALLTPVVLRPLARLATWPLGRLGVVPLLVRQNVLTALRRTAATVAPVAVAVGLTATMLCVQQAGDRTRLDQAREQTHADLVVLPDHGAKQLNAATLDALAGIPGARVTTVATARIYLGGSDGQVIDTLTGQGLTPDLTRQHAHSEGDRGLAGHLAEDFLVVDQHIARSDDLTVGQRVPAWLPDGTRTELRIAAVVQTGIGGDATFLSAAHTADGTAAHADRAWVTVEPGADRDGTAAALAAALKGQPVKTAPVSDYFDALSAKQHRQTPAAAVVVLGIAVGYALISVANTLLMAAAGRRRELAALALAGVTGRRPRAWWPARRCSPS